MKDPNIITDFELTTIKDLSVLFSFEIMDFEKLPEGVNGYFVSHEDYDWLNPTSIGERLPDNFFGVVLSKTPLPMEENKILPIDPGIDLCLINSRSYSIEQYLRLNKEE